MSTSDNIFLAARRPFIELAGWLGGTLGLEPVADPDLKAGVVRFRAPARTVEGDVYLTVEPNVYGEADPEPEDVSVRFFWGIAS